MNTFTTNTGQTIYNVHAAASCAGPCPMHHPTEHHMRDWPLTYRHDRGHLRAPLPARDRSSRSGQHLSRDGVRPQRQRCAWMDAARYDGRNHMSDANVTDDMATLLRTLSGYTEAPTVRRLADNLERPVAGRSYWGYDRTYSMLRRMERRGFVSRDSRRPAHWTVTPRGQDALNTHASG